MDDISLHEDILDELSFEPSLDAANIGVTVERGVVTLSGHVGSYAEKIAAEKAVQRVRGVRAVAEEI
ncbi:MAG TPA: BON domain-containing protein, partial [Gammaproteobacteria bacterium]|nr:BON domain-containing protein [Gammaproteobacteria bacterium]